jgi:hypothetical protein
MREVRKLGGVRRSLTDHVTNVIVDAADIQRDMLIGFRNLFGDHTGAAQGQVIRDLLETRAKFRQKAHRISEQFTGERQFEPIRRLLRPVIGPCYSITGYVRHYYGYEQ